MKKLCVVNLNALNNTTPTSTTNKVRINPNSNEVDINSSMGDSDFISDTETVGSANENPQKRKRQRLTHLTAEEKLMRRKLKNRIAAQSARDRKKVKMDDLEMTCDKLKEENEKLKKENALLKEKAQLLIDENRKLLKFKSDTESLPKPIVLQPVVRPAVQDLSIVAAAKPSLEADESAVFTKYASQPKRQLQGMFQRLICMLILQTLGLIRGELSNSTGNHQQQASNARLVKLKSSLAKLVRMANTRRMLLPKPQNSIRIMNTYKILDKPASHMSSMRLALLVSMIVKASDSSRRKVKNLF